MQEPAWRHINSLPRQNDDEEVRIFSKSDWLHNFYAGSLTHAIVICAVVAVAAFVTHLGRKETGLDRSRLNQRFGWALFLICLVVFLRDLRPDRIGWDASLPLHICDITGLMAAIAVQYRSEFARRILHFWGLALSSQAFLFPVLGAGPIHSDFWLYWIEHGAIVVAAIYDVTVNNYRPSWRDYRLATIYLAVYALIVVPIDAVFNLNYGYLGKTFCAQRSAIAALGPWPDRLPVIWLACILVMALLRLRLPPHSILALFSRQSLQLRSS